MIVLGVTGGIGMGKSTTSLMLEELGVPVIDSDVVAREVVEPGQPALSEISREFGLGVLGPGGRLDRGALARIVFKDEAKRHRLEGMLHPRIRERWLARVEEWRKESKALCAVVVPLLYETQAEAHCSKVLCVACSAGTQAERLSSRGWTAEHIGQRLAAQWPIGRKMGLSDYVVWSETPLAMHRLQLERVLRTMGVEA